MVQKMEKSTRRIFDSFMKQPVQVVTEAGVVQGKLKGVSGIWLFVSDGVNYFLVKDWIWIERRKRRE